ncbi:peroxisomal membrane protein 4 [Aureobasidium pullulans]|uniref:Peroxisomal membrane protein 4 n=1 Tax=Aureobasidium pullulans TaxID=5580 RepID=A0A4S8VZ50_AURPU|nr:peroxisomal membrane protein 4 [Aureobasidium pullulans]THW55974.1 peroxisomal membrane protein 4 [Aureobasidium pullulans]THX17927.1 peroxisomal membrane protein 4 [Aureobasidium pullulans]THX85751.1 peroxisomal membrane protein 4 [Aureobasidium pullulans]THY78857.1 peroxisomal membrane protein 4 [Aureobasidium pullulans]
MDISALQQTCTRILLNPDYQPPLSLLKALRNGLVYGTKIRFPHALVMILLFRSGPFPAKLASVLKATRQHATNLATFAFLYKAIMLLQKMIRPQQKEWKGDSFVAGLAGGYWVFGRRKSSVNQQIVIYVAARVVLAAASLAFQPRGDNTLLGGKYGGRGGMGLLSMSDKNREAVRAHAWPVFASLSWGCVMWMFRFYPEMLQPSLRSSMTYLYVDDVEKGEGIIADTYDRYDNADHWDSFRNFLVHNK